jgi:uncharacterized membrane protein YhaH (DUF805 family)
MVIKMDIMEIMKFSSEAKITRMTWWLSGLAFGVINMILGMVIPAGIATNIVGLLILVPAISFWVARLRDRGHTEPLAFALRIILLPWAIIECAFLAGTE